MIQTAYSVSSAGFSQLGWPVRRQDVIYSDGDLATPAKIINNVRILKRKARRTVSMAEHSITAIQKLIAGHYGLALTYWILFLIGALLFFVFGSMAVNDAAWGRYLAMLVLSVVWTFVLLVGIKRSFRGEDPGKALARIAMLFLALNLSNALATLSFI